MPNRKPLNCPGCGSKDHKTAIIPLGPFKGKWGRKCKICGRVFTREEVESILGVGK